jgi:hypothetical protein
MQRQWWEKPMAFICNHLLIIFVLLGIFLVLLFTSGLWWPLLFPASNFGRDQAPPEGNLEDLKPQLFSIADEYTSPDSRPYASDYLILPVDQEMDSNGEITTDRTQVIKGELQKVEPINDLKEDWPIASVLWIKQGRNEVLSLYRGSINGIEVGDDIIAEGVYVPEGKGIHLDKIYLDQSSSQQQTSNIDLLFYSAVAIVGICFALAGIKVFRGRKMNRNSNIAVLSLLLIALFMTGCRISIKNIIDPEGRVLVQTTICESKENTDFIKQVPGMLENLENRIAVFRAQGGLVENTLSGNEECYTLQRPFSGLGNIAYNKDQKFGENISWVFVDVIEEENTQVFRFTAKIDTAELYEFSSTISGTIQSEMKKQMDEIEMEYSVILPGEIIYHNADSAAKNTAAWIIPMGGKREVVIESQMDVADLPDAQEVVGKTSLFNQPYLQWVILGVVLFASLLILLFGGRR